MRLRWWCAGLLLLVCATARAHLIPPGQGSLNVVGDSIYVLLSVPAAALKGIDDNGDARISLAELNTHRAQATQQISDGLDLRAQGRAGRLLFEDILIPASDDPGVSSLITGTRELTVMRRYQWTGPVRDITLRLGLYSADTPSVVVRAVDGARRDALWFSARRPEQSFFESVSSRDDGKVRIWLWASLAVAVLAAGLLFSRF